MKALSRRPGRRLVEKLHFRVSFDGLTMRVREFWAEERYQHAFDTLECGCNLTREQATAVLNGRMKLAQRPGGTEGCDGILVEDNWRPSEAGFGFYPEATDVPLAAECAKLRRENRNLRERLDSEGGCVPPEPEEEEKPRTIAEIQRDFSGRFGLVPVADPFEERVQDANLRYALKKQGEQLLESLLTRDDRPTPGPTRDFTSGSGWVTNEGKFYPCEGPLEHIWLAGRLHPNLPAGQCPERHCEDKGWVKLSIGLTGIHIVSKQPPTQAQINTVFAWAAGRAGREQKAKEWLERNAP